MVPSPGQIWEYKSGRSQWKILGVYEESGTCAIELVSKEGADHEVGYVNGDYNLASMGRVFWSFVSGLLCAECEGAASQDDYLCKDCRRVTVDEAIEHP
jgi:hypothetical protein